MSGNVYILPNPDIRAEALRPNAIWPQHGMLQLHKLGRASALALIVREEIEGEPNPPPKVNEWTDGDIGTFPFPGVTYAAYIGGSRIEADPEIPGSETVPGFRANYDFRWWPGDWNQITFRFEEYLREDANVFQRVQSSLVHYQGSPLCDIEETINPNSPETWPRVPGLGPFTTPFPPVSSEGSPVFDRVMLVIYPDRPTNLNATLEMLETTAPGLGRNYIPGPRPPNADYRERRVFGPRKEYVILP